jgi:hypothetical protein
MCIDADVQFTGYLHEVCLPVAFVICVALYILLLHISFFKVHGICYLPL